VSGLWAGGIPPAIAGWHAPGDCGCARGRIGTHLLPNSSTTTSGWKAWKPLSLALLPMAAQLPGSPAQGPAIGGDGCACAGKKPPRIMSIQRTVMQRLAWPHLGPPTAVRAGAVRDCP